MKNKKIFGIPALALVLGLLVVGMGTAALVNHLSNTATVNVEVTSPIKIQLAPDLSGGSWGDNLDITTTSGSYFEFRIKEENLANLEITSKLIVKVQETGKQNVCSEIVKIRVNDAWDMVCTEKYDEENSDDDNDVYYLEFNLPQNNGETTLPVGHNEVYNVYVEMGNVLGTYNVEVLHVPVVA